MEKLEGIPVRLIPALICYESLSQKGEGRYTIIQEGQNHFKVVKQSGEGAGTVSDLSKRIMTQLQVGERGDRDFQDIVENESGSRQEEQLTLVKGALERLRREGCFSEGEEEEFVQDEITLVEAALITSAIKEKRRVPWDPFKFALDLLKYELKRMDKNEVRQWDPEGAPQSLKEVLELLPEIQKKDPEKARALMRNIRKEANSLKKSPSKS